MARARSSRRARGRSTRSGCNEDASACTRRPCRPPCEPCVRAAPIWGRHRAHPRVEARPLALGRAQPGAREAHAALLRHGECRGRADRAPARVVARRSARLRHLRERDSHRGVHPGAHRDPRSDRARARRALGAHPAARCRHLVDRPRVGVLHRRRSRRGAARHADARRLASHRPARRARARGARGVRARGRHRARRHVRRRHGALRAARRPGGRVVVRAAPALAARTPTHTPVITGE